MVAWFAKYGMPMEVIYAIKPEGGVMMDAHATVELIKADKVSTEKIEEAQAQIAFAEERRAMID